MLARQKILRGRPPRNNAPSSYNAQRRILRSFFSWCQREGLIGGNPTDGIHQRKEDRTPRHLEAETLKQLLSIPDLDTYAGLRDRALLLFQLDTGVRPGEALQLLPEHFNLAALETAIPAHVAKARQARTVVLSPQTAKAIRKLLDARQADWDDSVPVFCSASGRPMPEATWGWRVR